MRYGLLLASAGIALGLSTLAATPAAAQATCDLNGVSGGVNAAPANGGASATNSNALACGAVSLATGADSTAVGVLSSAIGDSSSAYGSHATAGGLESTAIGAFSAANGDNSTVLGVSAISNTPGGIAIGHGAIANGNGSIAIGSGASNASFANSVAIGAGTVNTAGNQVAVGGRTISQVAAGAISATSTDAVNGSQLFATNQNVAALQTSDTSQNARLTALEATSINLGDAIDRLDKRASGGTAVAIAMGGNTLLPGKSFSLTGNVGYYRNKAAIALQMGALINPNWAINAGVATGFNKAGKLGARAGFTVGW
jgi:autotransporter adhesin